MASPEEPALPQSLEQPATSAPAAPPSSPARIVVITLDGVRWEDAFQGAPRPEGARYADGAPRRATTPLMPSLLRLVAERGVAVGDPTCPHPVRASGPAVSLPGYFELFAGAPQATCKDNGCRPTEVDTFVDEARRAASSRGDVAVFASWAPYARAVARDTTGMTISTGRVKLALAAAEDDASLRAVHADGARARPYPGHADYRPDAFTTRAALRYLEVVRPRLLVVGLGDADEHAHRGEIAKYRAALRAGDVAIGEIDAALTRSEQGERTAVLVTTDHGRSRSLRGHGPSSPESSRVFIAAWGSGIVARGVVCASGPVRLADVAPTVRVLLGMPRPDDDLSPLVRELRGPPT